jgi:DNA-binding transcriptional MerR regulator
MDYYTQKDIIKITGLKRWQIQFYTEKLCIQSAFSGGRGSARNYTKDEVCLLAIAGVLGNWGIESVVIKKILEKIRKKNVPATIEINDEAKCSSIKIDIDKIISNLSFPTGGKVNK